MRGRPARHDFVPSGRITSRCFTSVRPSHREVIGRRSASYCFTVRGPWRRPGRPSCAERSPRALSRRGRRTGAAGTARRRGRDRRPGTALVRHQAGDEMHVAREPVELGDGDRARLPLRRASARAAASCGRRSSASAPLPVSISTCSATISKPSASANRATAARWASMPSPSGPARAEGRRRKYALQSGSD